MTKEERATKRLKRIPGAEHIDIEKKLNICDKVARRALIGFFAVLIVEFGLLLIVGQGELFNDIANLLNAIADGSHSRAHRRGLAIVGALVCVPMIVLPIIAALLLKNRWLQAEVDKEISDSHKSK